MSDALTPAPAVLELSAIDEGTSSHCHQCAAVKTLITAPRLMTRGSVDQYLALAPELVEWLIKTGQVTVIRMRGEERFDRRDLDLLIDTYKQTAQRRGK